MESLAPGSGLAALVVKGLMQSLWPDLGLVSVPVTKRQDCVWKM